MKTLCFRNKTIVNTPWLGFKKTENQTIEILESTGRPQKTKFEKPQTYIDLPELQRFYGRAIVIITPVEMPIRDINRPLSIIIFVLYLSVYRVVLGRIYD
jgi:hypothetical protein